MWSERPSYKRQVLGSSPRRNTTPMTVGLSSLRRRISERTQHTLYAKEASRLFNRATSIGVHIDM
jgi:hypothetical protein